MKEYAKAFYKSKQWQRCRAAYLKSVGGLCERCLRQGIYTPGKIVHHKIHITPENLGNPLVALDWNNLELVCYNCHTEIHEHDFNHPQRKRRYTIDENGAVTAIPES